MLMMRWKTVKPANDMPKIMMRPLLELVQGYNMHEIAQQGFDDPMTVLCE
jgi:hypothetical protein